ncbi:MAG: hypothetical protein V3S98_08535, partial [Dehalococcoidia bacterium]
MVDLQVLTFGQDRAQGEVTKSYPNLADRLMEAFVEARRLYDEEVKAGGETVHMGIDVSVLKQLGYCSGPPGAVERKSFSGKPVAVSISSVRRFTSGALWAGDDCRGHLDDTGFRCRHR